MNLNFDYCVQDAMGILSCSKTWYFDLQKFLSRVLLHCKTFFFLSRFCRIFSLI